MEINLSVTVIFFLLQIQVKTKLPKVLKGPLLTSALCASEIPPTDKGIKQKNKPQPSDFKSPDTLLPSCSKGDGQGREKEKGVTASSVSELLERENSEIHSEIRAHQCEEQFFVTEVI